MVVVIRRVIAVAATLLLSAVAVVAAGAPAGAWGCPDGEQDCYVTWGPRCYEAEGKCTVSLPLPFTAPESGGSVSFVSGDGTARAPGDYQPAQGWVALEPRSDKVEVTLSTKRDREQEADEEFAVHYRVNVKGVTVAAVAVVTIADGAPQG